MGSHDTFWIRGLNKSKYLFRTQGLEVYGWVRRNLATASQAKGEAKGFLSDNEIPGLQLEWRYMPKRHVISVALPLLGLNCIAGL